MDTRKFRSTILFQLVTVLAVVNVTAGGRRQRLSPVQAQALRHQIFLRLSRQKIRPLATSPAQPQFLTEHKPRAEGEGGGGGGDSALKTEEDFKAKCIRPSKDAAGKWQRCHPDCISWLIGENHKDGKGTQDAALLTIATDTLKNSCSLFAKAGCLGGPCAEPLLNKLLRRITGQRDEVMRKYSYWGLMAKHCDGPTGVMANKGGKKADAEKVKQAAKDLKKFREEFPLSNPTACVPLIGGTAKTPPEPPSPIYSLIPDPSANNCNQCGVNCVNWMLDDLGLSRGEGGKNSALRRCVNILVGQMFEQAGLRPMCFGFDSLDVDRNIDKVKSDMAKQLASLKLPGLNENWYDRWDENKFVVAVGG